MTTTASALRDFNSWMNQYRLAHGTRPSKRAIDSFFTSHLAAQKATSLQTRGLDMQQSQYDQNMALRQQEMDDLRKAREEQNQTMETKGIFDLGTSAAMLYPNLKGIGSDVAGFFGGGGGAVAESSIGVGSAAPAGGTVASMQPISSSPMIAGEGSSLAGGVGAGGMPWASAGAGAAALGLELTRDNLGEWTEEQIGTSGRHVMDVGTRAGEGALTGFAVGGPPGAAVGAGIGLLVGLGEEIFGGGSWLCSKVAMEQGLSKVEIESLIQLRKYVGSKYSKPWAFYLNHGVNLLNEGASQIRSKLISPVVTIINRGDIDKAFQFYRAYVLDLIKKYNPEKYEFSKHKLGC